MALLDKDGATLIAMVIPVLTIVAAPQLQNDVKDVSSGRKRLIKALSRSRAEALEVQDSQVRLGARQNEILMRQQQIVVGMVDAIPAGGDPALEAELAALDSEVQGMVPTLRQNFHNVKRARDRTSRARLRLRASKIWLAIGVIALTLGSVAELGVIVVALNVGIGPSERIVLRWLIPLSVVALLLDLQVRPLTALFSSIFADLSSLGKDWKVLSTLDNLPSGGVEEFLKTDSVPDLHSRRGRLLAARAVRMLRVLLASLIVALLCVITLGAMGLFVDTLVRH